MTLQQQPTLEEFLTWPEQKPHLEFIGGRVRAKAVPDFPHSYLQSELTRQLGNWCEPRDGYVLTEQRCVLTAEGERHTVLPDVAWFSSESLPSPPSGPLRVPPDLAVEILSPGDAYGDIQEKVLVYLRAGVRLVWVVDPRARNVTVHGPGRLAEVLPTTAVLQADELPGLAIHLGELFARLPTEPPSQPSIDA